MSEPAADPSPAAPSRSAWRGVVRDAAVIAAVCAVVGLVVNTVRPGGIPLVAKKEYEILVPCPVPVGKAKPLSPSDPQVTAPDTLVVDARSREEFAQWHPAGALNMEFDWLGPPPDKEVAIVAKRVARTKARRVVVYGDGDDPDSGREWARLLSGARLKSVFHVKGGAPALMKHSKKGQP